jgi:outer membrane protein TolC
MQRRHSGECLVPALLWVLVMAVAPALPAPASPNVLSPANPDSGLAEILAYLPGAPLSLAEAVTAARQGATAGRIAAAELAAATGAVRSEKGAFDPELFGETRWNSEQQPTASFFSGADVLKTKESSYEAGARITLPLGTELTASLNTSRLTTNSAFASLSPQYDTRGQLEVRQPLLNGFGPATRGDLSAAERDLEAARASYENVMLSVRAAVETTYWELYAAERDYAVVQLIRDRAEAFLAEASLRAKAGLVGPDQVANAQVFLAEQEQSLLDSEERLESISDRLGTLMGRRPTGGASRFRASEEPPRDFPLMEEEELIDLALARNLDLQAFERSLGAVRERARAARWRALPTLDLLASLGGNGLAGTGRDIVFPGSSDTLRTKVSGGFGESWAKVRDPPGAWGSSSHCPWETAAKAASTIGCAPRWIAPNSSWRRFAVPWRRMCEPSTGSSRGAGSV